MYQKIILDLDRILLSKKNIGIFVSGGFDSTLLTYLLFSERNKLGTGNNFSFFTVNRTDDSVVHANKIVSYICNEFADNNSMIRIVGDPDLHHSKQVSSGITEIYDRKDIDVILLADTSNPPAVQHGPIRTKSLDPKIYQPFFNYTKDVLVKMAIDLNLTDIMEMSHTCTESKLLRCNNCWQCMERAWAFKECKYNDPGVM